MLNEVQRNPNTIPIPPVNSDIQKALDEVNKVLSKHGFALQPITKIKKDAPRMAKYFINKYSKYLIASLMLRVVPKPQVNKKKRKKK